MRQNLHFECKLGLGEFLIGHATSQSDKVGHAAVRLGISCYDKMSGVSREYCPRSTCRSLRSVVFVL